MSSHTEANIEKMKQKIEECRHLEDTYFNCDTMRKNKSSNIFGKLSGVHINYQFRFVTSDKELYNLLSLYFNSKEKQVHFDSLQGNNSKEILPKSIVFPPPLINSSLNNFPMNNVPLNNVPSSKPKLSPDTSLFHFNVPNSPNSPNNYNPNSNNVNIIPNNNAIPANPIAKKEPNKEKKYKKEPIPIELRNKVWRSWCQGKMDGKCFSCDVDISYEHWECGHIHAEAHGGPTIESNLRPVCMPCNRGMTSQHMYLYMFINKLQGLKNLDPKDPEVQKRREEANKLMYANVKIDSMVNKGEMKKTEANKMKKELNNKREMTHVRLEKIEEIKNK